MYQSKNRWQVMQVLSGAFIAIATMEAVEQKDQAVKVHLELNLIVVWDPMERNGYQYDLRDVSAG